MAALVYISEPLEIFSDCDANAKNILRKETNTKLVAKGAIEKQLKLSGVGTLIVGAQAVYWFDKENGKGLVIQYNAIGLHAISRSTDNTPSIYLQIRASELCDSQGAVTVVITDDDDNEFEDPEDAMVEIELYFTNPETQVEQVFQSLCDGAVLFPDPVDESEEPSGIAFDMSALNDDRFEDAD